MFGPSLWTIHLPNWSRSFAQFCLHLRCGKFRLGHRGLETSKTSRFVPKMQLRRPLAPEVRILPVSLQEGCASAAGVAPSCPQVQRPFVPS